MNTKEVLIKDEMSEDRMDKYFLKGFMLFKKLQNPKPGNDFKENLGEKLMILAEKKQAQPNFFLGRIPYIASGIAIVLVAVISSFLLFTAKQPSQNNTAFTPDAKEQNKLVHYLNLPSTVRFEGSTADIKTIKLQIPARKSSYNLFNSVISTAFAAGPLMRPIVYLAPALGNSVPFSGNPDNANNPTRFHFFSYDLLSGEQRQLTRDSFAAPIDFTLSPQGFVIFSSNGDFKKINLSDLSIEDINSGKLRYDGPYPPSVSPNGGMIAYFRGLELAVSRFGLDSSDETYSLPDNVLKNQAVWSADEDSIYVQTVRDIGGLGANDILEINRSTKEIKTIISSDTAKHQLAFFGGSKYDSLLYIREIFGQNIDRILTVHNLVTGPIEYPALNGYMKSLVWTPNHNKLYYTQEENINGGSFTGGIREFEFSAEKTGEISKILESITSPYVYLVGFGKNENELIVSDSVLSSDGTSNIVSYYSFDLQSKITNELFSFKTPSKLQ